MTRLPILLFTAFAALSLSAQQRLTVVLDAARGGTEYGARIDPHTYEKQVTLELANRLRSLLTARDFNVVLTRNSDTLVANDQRAAVVNQNKQVVACVLLHATASGTGVHLWTSSFSDTAASGAVLWDEAQAPFVQRSQRLASELAAAFSRSHVAISSGHTWIRPLDNMQCPAVAIEVAPLDSDTTAADQSYQRRIADVIANELLAWRGRADVVASIVNPPPPPKPEPKPAGNSAAAGLSEPHTPSAASPQTGTPKPKTVAPAQETQPQ